MSDLTPATDEEQARWRASMTAALKSALAERDAEKARAERAEAEVERLRAGNWSHVTEVVPTVEAPDE